MAFKLSQYEMIIFDWDGTLMQSTDKIVNCMQCARTQFDLPPVSDRAIASVIGLSMHQALDRLFPGMNSDTKDRFYAHYSQIYREDNTPSPLIDGVESVIKNLHHAGTLLSVATGKSRKGLNRVLETTALSSFFHDSICADESESKPSPVMITTLLSRQSILPGKALMIGDSVHDAAMAKNAAVDFVGVLTGSDNFESLHRAGSLAVIDSVAGLMDV